MARSPTTISSGTILGFYPPSIAQAFQRAINSESADADLLYEDLLGALLSHLAWTTALASGGRGIRCALETGPASLGMLLQIVRSSCAEDIGAACDSLLGMEPSTFAASSFHAALDEAIRLRNAVIHENRLDLREAARTAVRKALDHASSLRFQAVIVPRALEEVRGTLRIYRAACYRGLSLRHPIWIETDVELAPKQAYLAIEGRSALLPLHPIALEGESCAGGALPELYVVRDLARLSVRSTALGREAPARVKAQVESALRDFQPRGKAWLTAKHFACPSLAIVASRRLGPDDTIAERYRIVRYLGSGHSSDVYEAVDDRGQARALKLVSAEIAAEAQVLERFRREVGVLRRIQHRNVLRHVDDGEDAGARFVVTELATGWSVRDGTVRDASELLASARSAGATGLDEATVLSLARDVAAGLAELHEHGIVHRDVKLSNVLLFEDAGGRRAVLGDLGIARGFGSSAVTYDGLPVGTPESMAPECGETRDAAPTLDVYAFGVLLYEALAGAPPFRGATPQETRSMHRMRLPPLRERAPDTSEGLASFVRMCLAKNPAARPKHGADILARLERLHEEAASAAGRVDIVRGHRLGHYAVQEPLEQIEGATLFRAVDERTGATVRVGILDDAIEAEEDARKHALAILAALQSARCETLVRVREYGEGDGYTWFLAEDRAPHALRTAENLEPADALTVIQGIATAVVALNRMGVAHGDVANAAGFHAPDGEGGARALLDLPKFRGDHSKEHDARDVLATAETALNRALERSSGAVRSAGSSARRELLQLGSASNAGPDWVAAWAASGAEAMRETALSSRLARGLHRHPAAAATAALILVSVLGFASYRVIALLRFLREVDAQRRAVAALVQGKQFCLALEKNRSSAEINAAVPRVRGRSAVLEILCAAQEGRSRPPILVLEPLAQAIEGPEDREATEDVPSDPDAILDWVEAQLVEPDPVPPELAYAFWRLATRAGYALLAPTPAPRLTLSAGIFESQVPCGTPPRAQCEIDSYLGVLLGALVPKEGGSVAGARRAISLVDRRLACDEPSWNQYTLECYRALARAELAEIQPATKDQVSRELRELATDERFQRGLAQGREITDRVFEPDYLPRSIPHGVLELRQRCAAGAATLER